jgi:diguanylate cyclase (GGDEF)-like protein/PAS domain S-box-containing protein
MHFVGMLALMTPIHVSYDVGLTLLSLGLPIVVTGAGLYAVSRYGATWRPIVAGGTLVGLGVVVMHYTGMAAMRMPGLTISYDPRLVSASVMIAIGAAITALWLAFYTAKTWHRLASAVVMGFAIAGMHYTAMAAAHFDVTHQAMDVADGGIAPAILAISVAGATGLLLLLSLQAAYFDRKLARISVDQAAVALNNMSQGLCMFDADNKLVMGNRRYAEIFGYPSDVLVPGLHFLQLLEISKSLGHYPDRTPEEVYAERLVLIRQRKPVTFYHKVGDDQTVAISHVPMENGGWLATCEDITERQNAEAQIAYMAHHDALTGLPNRLSFGEGMERALTRVRRGEQLAMLWLDLDHFKTVNDTLGHPAGDALLKAVGQRLQACVRETDIVARLGGDEFAILQVAGGQPEQSTKLAQRMIEALSKPYTIDGQDVVIGTSVGIAVAPNDGMDGSQLFKAADLALYRAKADGRDTYRFFETDMDAKMQARRALELDLRKALVNGEFEIHYQPLVNLAAHRVSGFEALLRWNHPERGRISPADFIPVAEEIGVIGQIGAWVLKEACAEAATWPDDVTLAVNLSPAQFRRRAVLLDVASALGSSGLSPNRLELEITETVMLQDTEATLATLHDLRNLGIRISMDDFGTGYSSLSYLRKFPFDKIKIDRSFISDLPDQENATSIVRAILALSTSFGITTTAEGVETKEQLDVLRFEGCTEVQGYYFSTPRPSSEIPGLLSTIPDIGRAAA